MKKWCVFVAGMVFGIVVNFGLMSDLVTSFGETEASAVVMLQEHSCDSCVTGCEEAGFRRGIPERFSQMVVSEKVLRIVSRDTDYSLKELRNCLTIIPRDDSCFIEIQASHEDPFAAREIANEVAGVFVAYLNEVEEQRNGRALKILDEELQEYGDLVQEHRKEVTILVQQYGIPGLRNSTEEELYLRARDELDRLMQDKLFLEIASLKIAGSKLSTRKAVSDQLVDFGNESQEYYDHIRGLNEKVDAFLGMGLGENHSEVRRAQEAAAKVMQHAKKEAVAFLETLNERAMELENEISKMDVIHRGGGDPPLAQAMLQHQYEIKKGEYERFMDLYHEVALKQDDLRLRLKLKPPLASIHQRAE